MSAAPDSRNPVPSPCINVCRMNEATGWCEGCFRSIDEIAAWASLSDTRRREICALLPRRSALVEAWLFPPAPGADAGRGDPNAA